MSLHQFGVCPSRPTVGHGRGCYCCPRCQTHFPALPPVDKRGGCGSAPPCVDCGQRGVIRIHGETAVRCWAHFIEHRAAIDDLSPFVSRPKLELIK